MTAVEHHFIGENKISRKIKDSLIIWKINNYQINVTPRSATVGVIRWQFKQGRRIIANGVVCQPIFKIKLGIDDWDSLETAMSILEEVTRIPEPLEYCKLSHKEWLKGYDASLLKQIPEIYERKKEQQTPAQA